MAKEETKKTEEAKPAEGEAGEEKTEESKKDKIVSTDLDKEVKEDKAEPTKLSDESSSDKESKETKKTAKKTAKQPKVGEVDLSALLKAGAHFGHQAQRWNPKMAPFIFTKRNNVHIFDLTITAEKLKEALEFLYNISANGGNVLFVGTKKQAQPIIEEEAKKADSPYVKERWLGGMLTNYPTISKRITYLEKLEKDIAENKFVTKKEKLDGDNKRKKLDTLLSGIRDMKKLPDALFVVDILKERNAIREATKLEIPVVGIVDTNANPEDVKYVIPSNDDAIKTIKIITEMVSNTIAEAKGTTQE